MQYVQEIGRSVYAVHADEEVNDVTIGRQPEAKDT